MMMTMKWILPPYYAAIIISSPDCDVRFMSVYQTQYNVDHRCSAVPPPPHSHWRATALSQSIPTDTQTTPQPTLGTPDGPQKGTSLPSAPVSTGLPLMALELTPRCLKLGQEHTVCHYICRPSCGSGPCSPTDSGSYGVSMSTPVPVVHRHPEHQLLRWTEEGTQHSFCVSLWTYNQGPIWPSMAAAWGRACTTPGLILLPSLPCILLFYFYWFYWDDIGSKIIRFKCITQQNLIYTLHHVPTAPSKVSFHPHFPFLCLPPLIPIWK